MKKSNNSIFPCKKIVVQSTSIGKFATPYITNQFGKHHMCFAKFSDHKILDSKQGSKSVEQSKSNSALSNRSILGVTRCSTPYFSNNSNYSQNGNASVYTNFQSSSLIVHRRIKSMNNDVLQTFSMQIKKY